MNIGSRIFLYLCVAARLKRVDVEREDFNVAIFAFAKSPNLSTELFKKAFGMHQENVKIKNL